MTRDETYLEEFLKDCGGAVDTELRRLIPPADREPTRLHKAIRHSVFAGGKRFRPALTFASAKAFGVPQDKIVTIASAIEMIHAYSLIHDDLPAMDDDELRRGRPTCHTEFGEATAILAGDALQTLAFQSIAEDGKLDHKIRIRIISELARAAGTPFGMAAGQQLDLEGEGKTVSSQKLEETHRRKTGAMIVASVRIGAIVGEADEVAYTTIGAYGETLGLLFQITDDILDVTQSTTMLGKTAGKDATVDKATYPALHGIEGSKEMARRIHEKACRELDAIGNPPLLREIADYVLRREN